MWQVSGRFLRTPIRIPQNNITLPHSGWQPAAFRHNFERKPNEVPIHSDWAWHAALY